MKSKIILIIFSCIILTSCGVTQKFTVEGHPGTEIYDPSNRFLGVIDNSGQTKIVLPRKQYGKKYLAYLLAKESNSDLYVPFALNYKNKKVLAPLWGGVAMPLTIGAGIGTSLASDDEAATVIGGALVGLGTAQLIAWPIYCAAAGPSERFRYEPIQTTIQNVNFVKPTYTANPKNRRKLNNSNRGNDGTSSEVKSFGEKSKKSLKDKTSSIVGNFDHIKGSLLDNKGKVVESYTDAKIIIDKIDNNNVSVRVLDDNGYEFFATPSKYSISNNKDGSLTLTNVGVKTAIITFSNNGKLEYYHPKVNIDGDIYILKVSKEPNILDDWETLIEMSSENAGFKEDNRQQWIRENNIEEIEQYCRIKLFNTYSASATYDNYINPIDNELAGEVIDFLRHGAKLNDPNCQFMLACVLSGNKSLRGHDDDFNEIIIPTPKDYKYLNDAEAKRYFKLFLTNPSLDVDNSAFGLKLDELMKLMTNAYQEAHLWDANTLKDFK